MDKKQKKEADKLLMLICMGFLVALFVGGSFGFMLAKISFDNNLETVADSYKDVITTLLETKEVDFERMMQSYEFCANLYGDDNGAWIINECTNLIIEREEDTLK